MKKAGDQEQLLTCELDLSQSKKAQQALPYLRLRRPEMYR
jgi:predicted amidohydrolase